MLVVLVAAMADGVAAGWDLFDLQICHHDQHSYHHHSLQIALEVSVAKNDDLMSLFEVQQDADPSR